MALKISIPTSLAASTGIMMEIVLVFGDSGVGGDNINVLRKKLWCHQCCDHGDSNSLKVTNFRIKHPPKGISK